MTALTTPITMVEAARAGQLTAQDATLIETFRPGFQQRPNQPLNFFDVFPWQDYPGAAGLEYDRELALGTATPRNWNETNTRTVSSTEKIKEMFKIYSLEIAHDAMLSRLSVGSATLARQISMAGKALFTLLHNHVFKGDEASSAAQMTGLQARVSGDQLVSNSASTGAALSIANLRDAIDRVYGDNIVICMGKALARRMDAAVGLAAVGAAIRSEQTQWGAKATTFDGIPIVPIADMKGADNILQFDEAAAGGGSSSTSIYVMSLGSEGVHGARNGGIMPDEAAPSTAEKALALSILAQVAVKREEAVARVYGITDAAVVA